MQFRISFLLLLAALPLAAQNADVDVLHYRIEVTVPQEGKEIRAAAELTVKPRTIPLHELVLDFGALAVDGVEVDGKSATFTREGQRLTIATNATDVFRARIRYHGAPADGLFLQPNKFGDRGVFADNWPNRAHHWFPSVDHPSDKATVEFVIVAPDRYDVIANGTRVETTSLQNGTKRTTWSESTPIPVHCMVFGAAELSVLRAGESNGAEVSYYVFPRDRENALVDFAGAKAVVDFLDETVGPYPYDKLALVESSTRFGGMENATAIFLDEKRINGEGKLESLVAHEIAHQWFGDSVTQTQWQDLWLSEGFATYFAHLFVQHEHGRERMMRGLRADRLEIFERDRKQPDVVRSARTDDLFKLLNTYNYEKGSWVLHMLRGIMGDPAFFAGIRDYYAAYRDRNTTTAEFRAVMERHAGQPLDWFFHQWLDEPGHPLVATSWTWESGKVTVDVEQKQSGTVFRMPAQIEVKGDGFARRENVVIDERSERFEIASDEKPSSVVLDPDEWVLAETSP